MEIQVKRCDGMSRYVWLDGALLRLSDFLASMEQRRDFADSMNVRHEEESCSN
jgi:hypothetical protein